MQAHILWREEDKIFEDLNAFEGFEVQHIVAKSKISQNIYLKELQKHEKNVSTGPTEINHQEISEESKALTKC